MKELDHFESLLCQLNLAYLQPAMNEREGYQVLAITRELLRMKNKVITIVDKSRKKVIPKSMVPVMASPGMTVDFIPVKGKANTRMEGVQVYVVKPSHFFNCETCGDCLAPNSRCDLNMLKGESSFGVKKMEPGVTIDPGSYYIFVTENDFEVEWVIYYEARTLELADAGKVIWLRVGE